VLFGSALRNFSVEPLLDGLAQWAPGPLPRKARERMVEPGETSVSGFVFKVQANMDPNHRDRIAFMRLCSGRFKRGMKLLHVRDGKMMAIASPILFFAQARETADEAWAGDIIGVPNHGTLRVGDTLTEKETLKFEGIPNFAPELLRRVIIDDAMKAKQLNRALDDLAEEGVVQVFHPLASSANCSSTCWLPACAANMACRCRTSRRRARWRAGCRAARRARSSVSPSASSRTWRATATARSSTCPRANGA
jgi:peptide chain release factor 3